MYNQEIKERFLEDHSAYNANFGGKCVVFEDISVLEREINKDFSQMSFDEALLAIKNVNIGTYKTAAAVQTLLKRYVCWCYEGKIFSDINRELLSIEVGDIDSSARIAELVFRTEEQLISEIKSIRPFDEGYPEAIIMLLAWIGVEQKDVLQISISDVDIPGRYVNLNGKKIEFSDTIADALKIYDKTKVGSRSAGGDSRPVYRDDSFDRYVRKYCPRSKLGNALTQTQIKHMVNHMNSIYVDRGNPPRFTGSNVVVSGGLYRIYQLEQQGIDVFSKKNKEAVSAAFIVNAKLYEILWLYKNYKKAFNL